MQKLPLIHTAHIGYAPTYTRVVGPLQTLPWEEDGERSPERIESPTYWPPSDPFHSVGEGPARSKRMGWGWGGTALPAAGTLHACAHTFAAEGVPPPVSTPSRVPRQCVKCIEQSSVRRPPASGVWPPWRGRGKGRGRAAPFPSLLVSGLRAIPSPSTSADNGRFTAGRRCWTGASRWEGGCVQPGPRSPPQVRVRQGGAHV